MGRKEGWLQVVAFAQVKKAKLKEIDDLLTCLLMGTDVHIYLLSPLIQQPVSAECLPCPF